ncbi:MAG: ADP-ribosylglycohydrolase family protein [Akkermansiaceae bacterium]|nr:ADP-ribosylglycohydrolase family protein [Akkermansiaceae bacterium]
MTSSAAAFDRARVSLVGLSTGDAIGEALSYQHYRCRELADFSAFRSGSVRFTDDTEMAIAICETLQRLKTIDEEVLAWAFASRFRRDPDRGYGRMARRVLEDIANGTPWRDVSSSAFGGGSFGNGAAMRVAPLGAYLADRLAEVPGMAARSAQITHFHPEGIAGAIAVAIAAAVAASRAGGDVQEASDSIWSAVLEWTPESRVRSRIEAARKFRDVDASEVAREVGNGAEISAQDTVPFCIWSACSNLGDYREAILTTIEVGGDCDTNAAIVGGIVGSFVGTESIPLDWIQAREVLPEF